MALLTKEETTKELKDRFKEYAQFGMVLRYMKDENVIDLSDLECMFFDKSQEKATFKYMSILKKIDPKYIDESYKLYSNEYPNDSSIDDKDYILKLNYLCVENILSDIKNVSKTIDRTYLNTYNFLLRPLNDSVTIIRK